MNDVSFCLYPGEILGIVGESGSGKSTVAKLITRLVDPTEGEIILDGQDITHLKGTALKDAYGKLQMVFQNPVGSFDPRRTLGDGIGESLRNKGMSKVQRRKKAAELLEQCGLDASYADRYPHQVSGGPVSYTHLDVYKRQFQEFVLAWWWERLWQCVVSPCRRW